MKTTIKLTASKAVIVEPCAHADLISLNVRQGVPFGFVSGESVYLTPDQAGALIFGLEKALEVMAVRAACALAEREAYRAAGQRASFEAECG